MTKGVLYSWNIASFHYCDKNKLFNNYYGLHYINKVNIRSLVQRSLNSDYDNGAALPSDG